MWVLLTWWMWCIFLIQEVSADACSSSPCENDGTCVPDWNNGYYCRCPVDRTGDNCQHMSLTCFPALAIEDTPSMTGNKQLFFNGLTARCEGILQSVSFYAKQAGTFWLDLWQKKDGFPDTYTLYFTTKITTSTAGPIVHRLTATLKVIPGLTVGTHSDPGLAHTLGLTSGNGSYMLWRTDQTDGDFPSGKYGTKQIAASDNIDADPLYATPSLQLHISSTPDTLNDGCAVYTASPGDRVDCGYAGITQAGCEAKGCCWDTSAAAAWCFLREDKTVFPYCDAQIDIVKREGVLADAGQFFPALTTTCHGLLSNILFYAKNAGTFYFDLWKATDSGTDHVLYYTKGFTVTAAGPYSMEVTGTVIIEPGLVFGLHNSDGVDGVDGVVAGGPTNPYATLRYSEVKQLREDSAESLMCAEERPLVHRQNGLCPSGHFFPSFTIKCYGLLTHILFYGYAAGTTYFDIWKMTEDERDYVLYYTKQLTVTGPGPVSEEVTETVFVEPGMVIGIHCTGSMKVIADAAYEVTYLYRSLNARRFKNKHEDITWEPGILHFSQLTHESDARRLPSLMVKVNPLPGLSQECRKRRSLTPMIAGPSTPAPGLTVFPDKSIPCPAVVLGVSFYASKSGTFWIHLLRPLGNPTTHYRVVFSVQAAADSDGLHHVTFEQETSHMVQQDDLLGIQDGSDTMNSLTYVKANEDILKATGALLAEGFSNSTTQHFSTQVLMNDISSGDQLPLQLHINDSTTLEPEYPPLRLHLKYGISWLSMRRAFVLFIVEVF